MIQQGEVIEAQHFNQLRRGLLRLIHFQPTVELLLRQACRAVDTGYAMIGQRGIVALGNEGDLVFQVGQSVVDRRCREHEHAGLDALLNDAAHQPIVARFLALVRGLVAEVVRLVDHHQVIIAPVHMGQVDVARASPVTGEVGVVQYIVIKAVSGKNIALVVGLVERPVIAQPLGAQHQHTVIAQLMVFDDGQCLKGFSQANTIGNDAAAETVELVYCTDDTITLEFVELFPYQCVADASGRFDDAVFIHLVAAALEQMVQHQDVDTVRITVIGNLFELCQQSGLRFRLFLEGIPLRVEPLTEHFAFFGGFRCLNQIKRVPRRDAQPIRAERE